MLKHVKPPVQQIMAHPQPAGVGPALTLDSTVPYPKPRDACDVACSFLMRPPRMIKHDLLLIKHGKRKF